MAIIENAAGDQAGVGASNDALRVDVRPVEHGAGGHYLLARRTGTLPATLAAGAHLFQFRHGDGTLLAVVHRLRAFFQTIAAFTAHQEVSFEAYIGRSFTVAASVGTTVAVSGNANKARTSFPTSKIDTNGAIRIAAAAAMTGHTVTLDANPFAVGLGSPNVVNAAAGTAYAPANRPVIDWNADPAEGVSPIILAQNEGIVITNGVVFPAAGTGVLAVEIHWSEVPAY